MRAILRFFKPILWTLPLLLRAQPPAITQEGVRNLASQMPPSLPGGALSPGALFSVRGLRLGGAGATRVIFRQKGADREAQLLECEAGYLEGRVPADAVTGNADLLVVRDGGASRPFHVRIAAGAFGIFSENGKGWGPGGPPASPGDPGVIRGTGLAASGAAEVWVGGAQASKVEVVLNARRPGVEEVRFVLAPNTPLGCHVPVLVKTKAGVSNAVTIPVAANGQPCPDSSGLGSGLSALLLLAKLMMRVRLVGGAPADFTEEVGAAIFPRAPDGPLFTGWKELPPAGACTAYSGNWISDSTAGGITGYLFASAGAGLDAGKGVLVSGPAGSITLEREPGGAGIYRRELGGGMPFTRYPKPAFLKEGAVRVSGGGGEIGNFSVDVKYPRPLKWVDAEKLETIVRAQGADVRWRGVSSAHRVLLLAINVDALAGGMGMCLCVAPAEAGHFRIPALMLANIPASQDIPGIPMNFVLAGLLPSAPARFQTRGVENGIAIATSLQGRTVSFR
jgi:uncharacterized protein (TIGR03437 family)